MSTYTNFFIRVNDIFIPIGSWSRNSILGSEFITRGPWSKIRPITSNELVDLIREFEKKQDSFNKEISELERKRDYVVDKCNSVDEKIEATERYNYRAIFVRFQRKQHVNLQFFLYCPD